MKLYIDNQSFEISSSKVITGVISLKLNDGLFFPEKNWNDNIALILSSWIESIAEILIGQDSRVSFYFFDGPFKFELIDTQKHSFLQLYYNNKCNVKQHININNSLASFKRELINCSEAAIKEFDKRKWVTPEVSHLKSLIKASV